MKKKLCLLLVLVLLVTAGCTPSDGSQTDSTPWITYESIDGNAVSDSGTVIFEYSYQQPTLSAGAAATVINTKLDNITSAFLYGSGGVQELTDMAKMDCGESWFTCYALDRKVSVARADDTVVSFRYVDYAFTGGVHGYSTEYGITYDMSTGEQLSLGSLTDNEQALKNFCREYILTLIKSDAYGEDGFFPGYEKSIDSVLNHWVLTPEGLEFIAPPYVIAAYAAGTIRFSVPYEELTDYLDERWLPAERGHGGGSLDVSKGGADVRFVLDSEGEDVVIRINGTVYDFSVEALGSYAEGDGYTYYITEQYLYSAQVSSLSIGLQIPSAADQPTTLIRCCSGNGSEHQFFLTPTEKGYELTRVTENLIQ